MHSFRPCRGICFLLLSLLPLSTAMAADTHNQLTAEEEAAGWQLLFDGESLEHWRTYQKPAPNPETRFSEHGFRVF